MKPWFEREAKVIKFPEPEKKVVQMPNVASYPDFITGVADLKARLGKGEISQDSHNKLYTDLIHRFMRKESFETPWFLREDQTQQIDQTLDSLVQKTKNDPQAKGVVDDLLDKIINFGQKVLGTKQESILDEQPEVATQAGDGRKLALAMALLDQMEKEGRGNELGKIFQLTDKTAKDLAPMLVKTLKQKAVSDSEAEAKKVTDSIKGLIYKLVQKVTGFDDAKYTEPEAKSFEATKSLFEKVFEKHIEKKDVPTEAIIEFIKDSVEGQVLDMASLVKQRSGKLRDFVKPKYQKVYDVLFNDLQQIVPGTTGGAIGPSELALAAIGNPSQKKRGGGDLQVGDEEYEVKSGFLGLGKRSGDGGRINANNIPKGSTAVGLMDRLFKQYGINEADIKKYLSPKFKPFSITTTTLKAWNQTFNDKKIKKPLVKKFLIDIVRMLGGNPNILKDKSPVVDVTDPTNSTSPRENIEKLIPGAMTMPDGSAGFNYMGMAKLISYAQMYSYAKEGNGNVLAINKANNTFAVTKGAEDFVQQIGKTMMPAKGLSITQDPQTASFSFTAVDQA